MAYLFNKISPSLGRGDEKERKMQNQVVNYLKTKVLGRQNTRIEG